MDSVAEEQQHIIDIAEKLATATVSSVSVSEDNIYINDAVDKPDPMVCCYFSYYCFYLFCC